MADSSNIDRLVVEHLPAALRLAVRLTGDRDTAEELVQEALLRVARGWRKFRGDAAFRTWLFRIVINVFRDSLRRRRLSVASLEDEAVDVPDPRGASPPSAAAAQELAERVAAEVSRLPPRQREVMVLLVFEGMTTKQTAALLEITEQNVHATLSVARAHLQKRLAPFLDVPQSYVTEE